MQNKLIVDSLPEPVITLTIEGYLLFWNPAAAASFGLDESSAGREFREVIVPHANPDEDVFASLVAAPAGARLERTIRRCDGEFSPFEFYLVRADQRENPIHILFARDISDRWLREKKLNHSYQNQRIMNSILQISLMPISLDEQLEFILDQILAIPTIDLLPNGAILLTGGEAGVSGPESATRFFRPAVGYLRQGPLRQMPLRPGGAVSGEIQFVQCIDENHDFIFASMKPHGHYCVPIVADDEVLGVVALYIEEGHQSTELETETLQAIANVLAGIIERKKMEGQLVSLIDHLKKTVNELDEERKFNESVITSLGSGLLVLDRNGVVEKSNPAARQVLLSRVFRR